MGTTKLPASLFKKTLALFEPNSHLFKAFKDKCKFPDAWKTEKKADLQKGWQITL